MYHSMTCTHHKCAFVSMYKLYYGNFSLSSETDIGKKRFGVGNQKLHRGLMHVVLENVCYGIYASVEAAYLKPSYFRNCKLEDVART